MTLDEQVASLTAWAVEMSEFCESQRNEVEMLRTALAIMSGVVGVAGDPKNAVATPPQFTAATRPSGSPDTRRLMAEDAVSVNGPSQSRLSAARRS